MYTVAQLLKLVDKFEKLATGTPVNKAASRLQFLINKYSQAVNLPPTGVKDLFGEIWPVNSPKGIQLIFEAEAVGGKPEYVYDTVTTTPYGGGNESQIEFPEGPESQTPTPLVDPTDPGYASSTGNPEPTDSSSQKKKPSAYPRIDTYTQLALNKLGYPCGKPDGVLGPATRKALDKYKADKGSGSDSAAIAAIHTEYQSEFPGMQVAYNDPNYSEQRGGKPAEQLAAPEVPPNPYAAKPMVDEKPYG